VYVLGKDEEVADYVQPPEEVEARQPQEVPWDRSPVENKGTESLPLEGQRP